MKALFLFTVLALSVSQMTWAQDNTKSEAQALECTLADQSCFKNLPNKRWTTKPPYKVPGSIDKNLGEGGQVQQPIEVPGADDAEGTN